MCTYVREKQTPERMIDSTVAMAETLQINYERAEAIVGASMRRAVPRCEPSPTSLLVRQDPRGARIASSRPFG